MAAEERSSAVRNVVEDAFSEHESLLASTRSRLARDVHLLTELTAGILAAGGTVFAAGNGGSASDAQHFVAELIGRFEREREPMRAFALGSDAPMTSAISNDFGFEVALSRQVEALARPGDLLLVLSTSGRSANVVAAARSAKALGASVASLTGRGGGDLAPISDLSIAVDSTTTARIQEMHGLCLHALANGLEVQATAI